MDEQPAKIETGIAGLDSMLAGGIPIGNQILIAGGPGAGKTLLSFEILYRNAKAGTPVAFIALEEQTAKVLANAKNAFSDFKDIDDLMAKKMFVLEGKDPMAGLFEQSEFQTYSFGNVVSFIESVVRINDARLVVIDSLSLMKLMLTDKLTYRKSMLSLIFNLRRLGVTSIITAEVPAPERSELRFSQEFFVFDGIIMMYQSGQEDKRVPMMEVVKMRGSSHSWALSPYDITSKGFKIFTIDQ